MNNRKILRTVRVSGGLIFKPGQEEQLAAVIKQSELNALIAGEALNGNWNSNVSDEETPAKEETAKKTKIKSRKTEDKS